MDCLWRKTIAGKNCAIRASDLDSEPLRMSVWQLSLTHSFPQVCAEAQYPAIPPVMAEGPRGSHGAAATKKPIPLLELALIRVSCSTEFSSTTEHSATNVPTIKSARPSQAIQVGFLPLKTAVLGAAALAHALAKQRSDFANDVLWSSRFSFALQLVEKTELTAATGVGYLLGVSEVLSRVLRAAWAAALARAQHCTRVGIFKR